MNRMKNVTVSYSQNILVLFLIAILFISSSIGLAFAGSSSATSNLESCNETQLLGISASASDTNFPASAVLDLNPQTLWSTFGKGVWLQLDLGKVRAVCNLDIAWYKGNQRNVNFIISVSKDGSTYKNVFDSKSSGTTTAFERYDLQGVDARYIKITVNGNTQNSYATIADLRVNTAGLENINPVEQPNVSSGSANQCTKAKISTVTASGHYKNDLTSNAIDNNPQTRWSNQIKPSSITLDLGSSKTVCNVDIQWYKGDSRVYGFVISVSKDNKKFNDVLKTKSSGSSSDPESYDFGDVSARYLRITVNGNTQNTFASIAEINVNINANGGSNTPPSSRSPGPSPGNDGVQMIYPTVAGGETWYFNPNNPVDGQFDSNGAEISKNSDGSWHLKPGTTRMNVYTNSAGLLSDNQRSNMATYDFSALAQKGYWYKPTDWKNVEATGYFKVSSSSSGDGISFVTRSVRHSNAIHDGCGGSSYHNNIRFDGTFQYKKEMWHVNYDILSPTKNGIGSIMNKWVGFKGVVYNLPDGTVKLESYVDKDNNNHWQKVEELVDSGHWGNDMTQCNAKTPGAAITWASPMFDYKSTGVTYDFQKLSLREIDPPHQ
jgi:F5/8 type C domain